jgi:tetratricopeptide (TPR) repeat protein
MTSERMKRETLARRAPRRLGTRALAAALALTALAACASPEQKLQKYTKSGEEFLAEGDLGRANVQFQNALKINEEYVPALLGLAHVAERKQDFQTMFGVLQTIVRLEPDNAPARIDLGKLMLIGGDERAALENADKALASAPGNLDAVALKSAIQLKLGDRVGAVELARQVIAAEPTNAEAIAVLATERALDKDFEGSLAIVEPALKAKPDEAVLHLMRMQLLANLGRKADLRKAHEDVINQFPENVGYRQLYARTLIDEGMTSEARAQLEEIVKRSPGKIEPILDVARVAYRLGGAGEAKTTLQRYVDEQPDNIDLKFAFAAFLRQEKDFAGSEALLSALDKTSKDKNVSRRARNEIAALRILEGKNNEARAIIDTVLKEDGKDADALMRRASLLIDDGDFDIAISDLRAVINDKPDSTAAKLLLATAFEKKGDVTMATSQMAQAVIDSGYEPRASHLFAKLLIKSNDAPRSEKTLLESLAKHPHDVDNLKLLAAVRLMQQNWRGAEETAKIIENVSADDGSAKRILGAAYTGLKNYGAAVEALTAANEDAPLAAQPLAMLVSAYLNDGRASEAETLLRAMVQKDSTNYPARLLLAQTLQALNRPDDVEAELKAAIAAAPDRAEAVESLYRVYRMGGRNDAAGEVVAAAVARAPDNDGFKVLEADFHIANGRPADAIAIYTDVLTRRPKDLLVANNFASLTLELNPNAAAKAKALEVANVLADAESPFFLDTYGWALYHNGKFKEAVAVLEKAVAGAQNFAEARYHLGAALVASGETERGRGELQQAITAGGAASFVDDAKRILAQN